jgi:hypothetical protein
MDYLQPTDGGMKYPDKVSLKNISKMPGGWFAIGTGALAIGAIVYYLFKALPFLIAGAANLSIFILELVGLAILLMIVTSKTFWKTISLFWYQIMKKMLGVVVKMDPLTILQQGINRLRDKYVMLEDNVTKLGGVLEQMKRDLTKYEDEFKRNVNRRTAAQEKLSKPNLSEDERLQTQSNYVIINNEIVRLEKTIRMQRARIDQSTRFLQIMKKLKIYAATKLKDSENEHKWRSQEFENAKKQAKAMDSIKAIFRGDWSESLEQELAINYVNETINNSIAEIEELMDGSNTLLSDFELDSEANLHKVDEILSKFEKNGFSAFNDNKTTDVPYQAAEQQAALPNGVGTQTLTTDMFKTPEAVEIPKKNQYF